MFSSKMDQSIQARCQGTDLRILKYPHPARALALWSRRLNDGSVAKIAKEMLLLMYAAEGVGLAAPRVGVNKRLMVYNEEGDQKSGLNSVW
jgi:peptide deformylase